MVHHPQYHGDGESLQTDVMRFMAIIAFCLIAILALVRNTDSGPATSRQPLTGEERPSPAPSVASPSAGDPTTPASPSPRAGKSTGASTPVDPRPPASPAIHSERHQSVAHGAEDQGLSSRFASDGDFLQLVTGGVIQVFAYRARNVLGLDRNLEFLATDGPEEVYELLPETIPTQIFAALQRVVPDAGSYRWGIRMPRALERKVRQLVDHDAHGELVIDRYGSVHHAG